MRPQLPAHAVQRRGDVGVLDQVREGIVAGEHHVEGAGHGLGERAHVGDAEGDVDVERRCLVSGALHGAGADVGGMDGVTAERQPDRLGADAAAAIEDRDGTVSERRPDESIEPLALPPHRALQSA